MSNKRIHITYSGSVQGVGFRWTAANLANDAGITGWVMNLSDGKVELVAEGDETNLSEFMSNIRQEMGSYIDDADVSWQEYTGEFNRFNIRRERP